MTAQTDPAIRIPVARLTRRGGHRFDIVPDAPACAALAAALDLTQLRKLRFAGEIVAEAQRGWRLTATLGATVVQPCGVTLAPVTTRIDEPVLRRFTPDLDLPDVTPGEEIEMPEDDTLEPLGDVIDLGQVMTEALALALPLWPRSEGATLDHAADTPVDDTETHRPFSALSSLRAQLADDAPSDDTTTTDRDRRDTDTTD